MNILLTIFDLFKSLGGGQTSYRAIIKHRPHDRFYYFIQNERPDAFRPENVRAIPYLPHYSKRSPNLLPGHDDYYTSFIDSFNLAYSAKCVLGDMHFDVVDAPDFHQYGLFIRTALEWHGIRVDTVALALHGKLSNSLASNWPVTGLLPPTDSRYRNAYLNLPAMRVAEHLQFRTADTRYTCVGPAYQKQWRSYADLPVNCFDPLIAVNDMHPHCPASSPSPPDIYFIGRREKIKGPDLFIDLISWLQPGSYGRVELIGPDGFNYLGLGSERILMRAAKLRSVKIAIRSSINSQELSEIYRQRSLIVLPSRYDTLNFIVLEALSHGCPVVISKAAGVSDLMEERHPQIPLAVIDIGCSRQGASVIQDILTDYDGYRRRLCEALQTLRGERSTVESIYEVRDKIDHRARAITRELATTFLLFNPPRTPGFLSPQHLGMLVREMVAVLPQPVNRAVARLFPAKRLADLKTLYRLVRGGGRRRWAKAKIENIIRARSRLSPKAVAQIALIANTKALKAAIRSAPERTSGEVDRKVALLSGFANTYLVDRVRIYRELARLERKRGRPLIAATYGLRILRWLDKDVFGDLPAIVHTLDENGYHQEAHTALAMFGPNGRCYDNCLALLNGRLEEHRTKPNLPLQILDDHRPARAFKAGVIVSLYRAANKLPEFLKMLRQQTLIQAGDAEVIFVDSGSPTDEYRILKQVGAENPTLPFVYARAERRETIQAAWNRGLQLSRAEYVTFLGVDEGIRPDCLELLGRELDADPELDWVVSDTLVTSVDKNGVFDSDVMPYDRSRYTASSHYLDCTYLNYVGCMYRRSIHTRFGYYDESFGAAGDNEFKNRVLPFIKTKYVPAMLGVFNNYPEERKTQSPRAEIEDLRAWYLHRTEAGMAYAFVTKDVDDATALLHQTLSYRKSYTEGHVSSDFDLALSVARYLERRGVLAAPMFLANIETILANLRSLELLCNSWRRMGAVYRLIGMWRHAKRMAAQHRYELGLAETPVYEIFNDNRYEQHYWPWSETSAAPSLRKSLPGTKSLSAKPRGLARIGGS